MVNQVDAGRCGFVGRGSARRNLLAALALLLVVGTPSPRVQADEQASPAESRAPASAAYADATVWLLEMEPRDAACWLGKREPTRAKPLQRLRPEGARWLLRAVQRSPRARIVTVEHMPDVGVPRMEMEHVATQSYVQDYDVEIAPDGTLVADPLIGLLQHGSRCALAVTRGEDDALAWSLEVTQAALRLPIPTFISQLAEGMAPVTIQLPEMGVARVLRELPTHGGWFLVGHGFDHRQSASHGPRRQLMLVRAGALPAQVPAGAAAPSAGSAYLTEAVVFDHPAASLPAGYDGQVRELGGATAWFEGLRGGPVLAGGERAGVIALPTVLGHAGDAARIEVRDGERPPLVLDVKLSADEVLRTFRLGGETPELDLEIAYQDAEHAKRSWSRFVSAGDVFVAPLVASPEGAKAPGAGRYLALRVTRISLDEAPARK